MQRRSSKSAAIYIPIGVLLIILLTILGTSGFLRIMEIEVDGAVMYSDDEIIGASGISMGNHLFFIDSSAAASRIEQVLPFINGVTVTRVPPGAVRIEVSESTALAFVVSASEALIIDSSGRVLGRAGATPDDLIAIKGFTTGEIIEGSRLKAVQGGEYQLDIMLDILGAFEKEGMEKLVTYLDVTYITQIEFDYKIRYTVVLGGASNLKQKLTSLPGAIEVVEKTYPQGVTGTLRAEPNGEWRFSSEK